jgi:hypothetical protein
MVFRIFAIASRFSVDYLIVAYTVLLEPFLRYALMFYCPRSEEANEVTFIEPSANLFDDIGVGFRVCHAVWTFFIRNVFTDCAVDINDEDLLCHDASALCSRRTDLLSL